MRSRLFPPALILSALSVCAAACDGSATTPLDGATPDTVSAIDSGPGPDSSVPDVAVDLVPADARAADLAADVRLGDAQPSDLKTTDGKKGDAYVGCPFNLNDPACNSRCRTASV